MAIGIGFGAGRSRLAAAVALAGPVAAAAWSVPLALAAHGALRARGREAAPRDAAGSLPTLSVVIPALDEASVIGALITDLGRQDHRARDGAPQFEVVVIDDGSRDGTGEIARRAFAEAKLASVSRVVRREQSDLNGKGAALADIDLATLSGTAMVVLDADARIDSTFLRRAALLLDRGHTAITARRRMLMPHRGALRQFVAQVQDDEQTIDGTIQLGRSRLRAGSEFRGDGSVITLDALSAAGGWDPGALTEDLELAGRLLAARGTSVSWDADLVVWEQPVVALRALLRQRLRWAEGLVRRELRVTPAVLRSGAVPLSRRALVLAYSAQSLAPLAAIGLLASARSRGSRRILTGMAVAYAFSGLVAGTVSPRDPGAPRLPYAIRAGKAVAVVAFSSIWVAVLPLAWLRAAVAPHRPPFAKTAHGPEFDDPPVAAGHVPPNACPRPG